MKIILSVLVLFFSLCANVFAQDFEISQPIIGSESNVPQVSYQEYWETYAQKNEQKAKSYWLTLNNKVLDKPCKIVAIIKLDKEGSLLDYTISEGSENKELSKLVAESINKGAPYEKLPGDLNLETIKIKITFGHNVALSKEDAAAPIFKHSEYNPNYKPDDKEKWEKASSSDFHEMYNWMKRQTLKKELAQNTQPVSSANSNDSASNTALWITYMRKLRATIKKNWHPEKSKPFNKTVVVFTINRDGSLKDSKITVSSGSKDMDNAALRAVNSSAPFDKLPEEYKSETVDIEFTFTNGTFMAEPAYSNQDKARPNWAKENHKSRQPYLEQPKLPNEHI